MTNPSVTIPVKLIFGDDIRMVAIDPSTASGQFVATVAGKYNISYDVEKEDGDAFYALYSFKYVDSDEDVVTISDKLDFKMWFDTVKCNLNAKPVRLSLVKKVGCDKPDKRSDSPARADKPGRSLNWWDKKAKYERKLGKLKMLPSQVKAGMIVEIIGDDISLAAYIHDKTHQVKGKGKGLKGAKGKGEKGKGEKGKGEKGKAFAQFADAPCPWSISDHEGTRDHDPWFSTWGYEDSGYEYWPTNSWYFPEPEIYPRSGRGSDRGSKKDTMARFVSDVTVLPSQVLASGEQFTKTWRVRNDSEEPWPSDVYLLCVGGDPMDEPLHPPGEPKWHKWNGNSCLPGEAVDVSVVLTAPTKCGTHEAYWRLCCSSPERGFKKFGMRLRLLMVVDDKLPLGSELASLGASLPGNQADDVAAPTEDLKGKGAFKGKGKGKGFKGKGGAFHGHEKGGHEGEKGGCKKLMARFVRDVTIPSGETVLAGAEFTKTWRVRNDSGYQWPANVLILFVGGDSMDAAGEDFSVKTQKPVFSKDVCLPGEELDVSIQLTAPTKIGTYEAYWRLCANFPDRGFKKFGMRLRVKVAVCGADVAPDSGNKVVVSGGEVTPDSGSGNEESTDFVHL